MDVLRGGQAGGVVNTLGMKHRWRNRAPRAAPYPVHNEDLADAELLLELFGGDGHRVEVAETPEGCRGAEGLNTKNRVKSLSCNRELVSCLKLLFTTKW